MNHPARRPNRLARLSLASLATAAAVTASVLTLGCDNVSDGKALALQTEAAQLRLVGGADDKVQSALQTVDSASNLSPAIVQGQHAYGQFLLAKANSEAATLAEKQRQVEDLVFRIGVVLRQADAARANADFARSLNPAERVAAATTFANNVRGNGSQATFAVLNGQGGGENANNVQLSTLANAQQEKSRLDGEIAKTQDQINTLTQQRDAALTQAGQISSAMESQNSSQRVQSTQQVAQLRTQAAQLSRQISDANNNLERLKADQGVQTALIEQLNGTLEATQQQTEAMQQGWQAIQAAAEQQLTTARNMISGGGDAKNQTVKYLVGELNKNLDDLNKQHEAVVAAYNDAIEHLQKAFTSAGTVNSDLANAKSSTAEPFEGKAWDELMSLISTDPITLDKAAAQRALADAEASHARVLSSMLQTARLFDTVGGALHVPSMAPFDISKLTTDAVNAFTAADAAYTDADGLLDGVSLQGNNLQPLKPAKATAKITGLYAHVLLCRLADASGAGGEIPKKAKTLLESANAAAGDAADNDIALPPLPSEIVVKKRAPTDEQNPAGGNTTTPADEQKPADDTAPAGGTTGAQ